MKQKELMEKCLCEIEVKEMEKKRKRTATKKNGVNDDGDAAPYGGE